MGRRFVQERYQPCTRRPSSRTGTASTGRAHGSEEGSPQVGRSEVRTWREQERRERNAPTEAWHAQERQERTWRESEEPQASNRDRPLRSTEKGSESSEKT